MFTDLGPGILPYQYAFIQMPPSTAVHLFYWAVKYVTRQRLVVAGWDTNDPVFYEQCNGARPQGAVELSWLPRQVLQGTPNPTLPRIPRNQVRYLSARVFGVLTKNIASILESVKPVFTMASVGAANGVGLTSYGPVDLPLTLDLTDMRGRREHYTLSLCIEDVSVYQQLRQAHPNSPLDNCIQDFSNGGVKIRLSYTPLTARGRSRNARTFDVIFPLDPLRVILRGHERITFAQGRLAALL
jgi:hypothetical protein